MRPAPDPRTLDQPARHRHTFDDLLRGRFYTWEQCECGAATLPKPIPEATHWIPKRPCPAPGCTSERREYSLACRAHYVMIPSSLRSKIRRHQAGILDGTSCGANLEAQMVKCRRIWAEREPWAVGG